MYDSRERQKFISDAQYVREMQHKMDSEYQACLRRQEQNREQTERKREQHARQEQRQKTLSSIYATRSYERPWISGIPATRQTSVDEGSGSSIKSYANRPDSKFPAIEKTSSKQKQKPPMSSSKVTSVAQKQSLLRRKRMNQGGLLGSTDTQNMRKLEDRDRQALLLQAKAQVASAPDLGVTNETTLTNRKRSQERRNLMQSSKLNLDHKGLNKDSKIGSVLSQAQQSPAWSSASALQGAHSSLSNESHSPSLTPTKMAPLRFRGENLFSMLCLNMEDSCEENDTTDDVLEKEFLSFNLNHSLTPRGQISKFTGSSLAQDEQCSSVETGDDRSISARIVESSHQPLRQHNVMDTAMEQSSLRRRNSRDHVKAYTSDGNSSEGADCNKNEIPLFSSRSSRAESRPGSAPVEETLNNISCIDKPSVSVYNRGLQAYESNQRRYTDLLTSARSTVHRPLLYSAYNTPRSLIQSAHRAEVPTNLSLTTSQVLDLDGSSRFNVRRPLTPIRSRDSLAATESYESSSPIVSVPEDNSLLEDNIDNGLKSTSPNAPLHDEESLLNSHSSFLSIDSSNPSLFQTNFTAHLHMAGTLHDQLPLALIAVSDLQNPSNAMSNIEAYDTTSTKEIKNADPEKLKKLQESLLAEDSEEEGDQCRICQIAGGSLTNPLVEPCGCVGTLQFVHQECLKTWLKAKIKSGAELGAVKTCELCKQGLITDLDDFDVNDYYRNHQQSRAQSELMNSGLYLVLLLHLYEQRFAELMRLNYNQANSDRIRSRGTMDKRVLTRLSSEFGIWQRLLY